MKSVDRIIRYLSGELTPEQSRNFREEMENNPRLREEYDQFSAAYRLIGDQIRRMDEEAFRSRLERVMEKRGDHKDRRRARRRPGWYFFLPVAASLAILLAIYVLNQRQDLYKEFFDPGGDPVLQVLSQKTRNANGSSMDFYTQGKFRAAYDRAEESLSNDPADRMSLLVQLLAALELDLEQDSRIVADHIEADTMDVMGQSLTWYHAIAMVKTGRESEALELLEPLVDQPGPYHSNAHKLQKMLKK
jgi:hypothetical protein